MGEIVRVPGSVTEAVERLKGIDRLMTAREWERAMIVWSCCRKDPGGRPALDGGNLSSSGQVSLVEFAGQRITGLSSRLTVQRYYDAWQSLVNHGQAPELVPGTEIELPSVEWKAHFNASNSGGRPRANPKEVANRINNPTSPDDNYGDQLISELSPEALRELVARNPRIAEAVADNGRRIIADHHLDAIANGGAVTPPRPAPTLPVVDAVEATLKAWARVSALADEMLDALADYGVATGDQAEDLQRWALALVDHIASNASRSV